MLENMEKTMFSEANHHELVTEALNGSRPVDEQVLSSLAVLEEKLEQLKKLGSQFAGITLSPAAKRLARQAAVPA